jgi:hypothetical protein
VQQITYVHHQRALHPAITRIVGQFNPTGGCRMAKRKAKKAGKKKAAKKK